MREKRERGRKTAGAYILPLFPPPGGGEFFQVESFSGEVFQVDTEDMKKKLRSSGEVFQVGGGGIFSSFRKNIRPWNFFKLKMSSGEVFQVGLSDREVLI